MSEDQNRSPLSAIRAISEDLISHDSIVTTPRHPSAARGRSSRTDPCSPPAPPACAATSAHRCAGRSACRARDGDVDAVTQQLLRDALVELGHNYPLAERMGTKRGQARRRLGVPRRLTLRYCPTVGTVRVVLAGSAQLVEVPPNGRRRYPPRRGRKQRFAPELAGHVVTVVSDVCFQAVTFFTLDFTPKCVVMSASNRLRI